MFVVTADQRGSTKVGVRVDELLELLGAGPHPWAEHFALPLERTVGDEVQAVLTDSRAAVDLALALARMGDWSVGVGAGPVDEPLAATSRESSGPAFVHARGAVERAKGKGEPAPVVVAGEDSQSAEHATAILQLLSAVAQRRSAAGWEVADLLRPDLAEPAMTQRDAAQRLGISNQAVSQRVASAMIDEERRARPAAAALVARAGAQASPAPREGSRR